MVSVEALVFVAIVVVLPIVMFCLWLWGNIIESNKQSKHRRRNYTVTPIEEQHKEEKEQEEDQFMLEYEELGDNW
jgi:hypothetical protein